MGDGVAGWEIGGVEGCFEILRDRFQLKANFKFQASSVVITGPSGSGKTTFFRVLAGLESGAKGWIKYKNRPWQESATHAFIPPWKRQVGYVPQDGLLFPTLSVFENLKFSWAASSKIPLQDIESVVENLSIQNLLNCRPSILSGGERQRVALGRALLAKPKLLLLDESFSALDRPLRRRIMGFLATHCRENQLPWILITHEVSDLNLLSTGPEDQLEKWEIQDGILERGHRL